MLRAIYKGGSQLILPNPRDIDIVKVYDTKEEAYAERERNTDHSVDWHFASIGLIPRVCLFCYIFPMMELVEGEEIKELKEFSMLDHKEEYKELVKEFLKKDDWYDKRWYYIYVAMCMFKKNKLELTEQEKEQAQKIHDRGVSEEMFNTLVDYFK